jgi:hypothetical protein
MSFGILLAGIAVGVVCSDAIRYLLFIFCVLVGQLLILVRLVYKFIGGHTRSTVVLVCSCRASFIKSHNLSFFELKRKKRTIGVPLTAFSEKTAHSKKKIVFEQKEIIFSRKSTFCETSPLTAFIPCSSLPDCFPTKKRSGCTGPRD